MFQQLQFKWIWIPNLWQLCYFASWDRKTGFLLSHHLQVCSPFSSDEQVPLIYYCLCFCLQTHRELDRPADPERCRYGAVHWTTETVSVDAVIWREGEGRQVIDTSLYFSPTVLQTWKKAGEPITVNLLISETVVSVQLRTHVAAATAPQPAI